MMYPREDAGSFGGSPRALPLKLSGLEPDMLAGVLGLGGRAGDARLADCDLLKFAECPGQAAPGSGSASASRMARAAATRATTAAGAATAALKFTNIRH